MGCAALQGTQDIASAFLDKGANFFVGWDSSVSIIHTDTSTVALVQLLSIGRSVPAATREASGSDPVYGAKLQYLDWNTLVQNRASDLVSRLVVWAALATILVVGPMAVFVAPRIIASLDRIRERMTIREKKSTATGENQTPGHQ